MSSERLCKCKLWRFQNFVQSVYSLNTMVFSPLPPPPSPNIYLSIHASHTIYRVRIHLAGTQLVFSERKNVLWQSIISSLYSRGWPPVAHRLLFRSNVLLGHSYTHCWLWFLFWLPQQRWVVGTEPIWPAKSQVFTIWPFTENFCHPLLYPQTSLPSPYMLL